MDILHWPEFAVLLILVRFRERGFPGCRRGFPWDCQRGLLLPFVEATVFPREESGFDAEEQG